MSLSLTSLCPLLALLAGVAASSVFQLQRLVAINGTLQQSYEADTDQTCGTLCVDQMGCGGFSMEQDGTCRLYSMVSFETAPDNEPGQRIYRRIGSGKCLPGFGWCEGTAVCLSHVSGTVPYPEAVTACSGLGGRLTVPRSEAHNTCIQEICLSTGSSTVWLGVTDDDQDRVYHGADGLGISPESDDWWGTDERLHSEELNPEPLVIFFHGGYWADAPLDYLSEPVCETPALN